jgi:hypothetical protein
MTNNKMMTAVEYLENEFLKLYHDTNFKTFEEFDSQRIKLWEQAKEMEKKQLIKSYKDGIQDMAIGQYYKPKHYYENNYEKSR